MPSLSPVAVRGCPAASWDLFDKGKSQPLLADPARRVAWGRFHPYGYGTDQAIHSSYSNWTPATNMPLPQNPVPPTTNYPPTTMPGEPYSKAPISGAPVFGTDPQEVSLSSSAAPPVQVPLASAEQSRQQPPQGVARTPYSYAPPTTGPPPLSMSTQTDAAVNVPRYVDTNPRPTKSPRHGSHPSITSTSSIGNNNDGSSEYRYSSSYPPPVSQQNTSEMPVSNYATDTTASGTNPTPSRDYYAPSAGWTATAGETSSTVAYSNESRSYTSPGQYKSSAVAAPVKSEPLSTSAGSSAVYNGQQRGSFDGMNHYSWHAV